MEFHVKFSNILLKDCRVILRMVLTWEAFNTMEYLGFSDLSIVNIGSFSLTTLPVVNLKKKGFAKFTFGAAFPAQI